MVLTVFWIPCGSCYSSLPYGYVVLMVTPFVGD